MFTTHNTKSKNTFMFSHTGLENSNNKVWCILLYKIWYKFVNVSGANSLVEYLVFIERLGSHLI
jgi:hypothetical protein